MITLFFAITMVAVFGRLLGFAIRFSWGAARVVLSLVLLPITIIGAFAMGLLRLAFPVLAVVGLVSLFRDRRYIDA